MSVPLREIAFILPLALPSLNVRDRQHWAERHRQQVTLQQEVMAALGGPAHFPRPPFDRARVTVVRISAGQLDVDNAYASAKSLLDCLKLCGPRNPLGLNIIVDDSPDRLELVVTQQRGPVGGGQMLVRIEELPPAEPPPMSIKTGKSKRPMTREQMTFIKRKKRAAVAAPPVVMPEDFSDPDWVEKWLDGKTAILRGG